MRHRSPQALRHVAYALDPGAIAAIRSCVVDEIDHLDPDATHSLILRHHWSRSLATAYLEGVEDVIDACESMAIFEANGAVFTLTERPTRADWPAPMIIYVADVYDAQNEICAAHFEVAVGPDGRPEADELLAG